MWRRSASPPLHSSASLRFICSGRPGVPMPSTLSRRLFRATLPLAALFALAACGSGSDADGGDGAWGAGPPPLVVAMTVKAQSIPNIVELPGRIEAVRTAEVRARSDGIIERRLYQEG